MGKDGEVVLFFPPAFGGWLVDSSGFFVPWANLRKASKNETTG